MLLARDVPLLLDGSFIAGCLLGFVLFLGALYLTALVVAAGVRRGWQLGDPSANRHA